MRLLSGIKMYFGAESMCRVVGGDGDGVINDDDSEANITKSRAVSHTYTGKNSWRFEYFFLSLDLHHPVIDVSRRVFIKYSVY